MLSAPATSQSDLARALEAAWRAEGFSVASTSTDLDFTVEVDAFSVHHFISSRDRGFRVSLSMRGSRHALSVTEELEALPLHSLEKELLRMAMGGASSSLVRDSVVVMRGLCARWSADGDAFLTLVAALRADKAQPDLRRADLPSFELPADSHALAPIVSLAVRALAPLVEAGWSRLRVGTAPRAYAFELSHPRGLGLHVYVASIASPAAVWVVDARLDLAQRASRALPWSRFMPTSALRSHAATRDPFAGLSVVAHEVASRPEAVAGDGSLAAGG